LSVFLSVHIQHNNRCFKSIEICVCLVCGVCEMIWWRHCLSGVRFSHHAQYAVSLICVQCAVDLSLYLAHWYRESRALQRDTACRCSSPIVVAQSIVSYRIIKTTHSFHNYNRAPVLQRSIHNLIPLHPTTTVMYAYILLNHSNHMYPYFIL